MFTFLLVQIYEVKHDYYLMEFHAIEKTDIKSKKVNNYHLW